MTPNLFPLLEADPVIRELLGHKPVRVFPWGQAPQGVAYPYVTYGLVGGTPENYLGQLPQVDLLPTQVDIWAKDGNSCLSVACRVRDVLEPHHHLTGMSNMDRDRETGSYHMRLDFSCYTFR